jgi:murein DD-endopeptidase MepM/ murein hydrolase activator NlpD
LRIDRLFLLCIVVLFAAGMSCPAFAGEQTTAPEVTLEPKKVGPGDILIVTVKNVSGPVEGTFNGKKVYFSPSKESVKAVLGIDLLTEPGTYDLQIAAAGTALQRTVTISEKAYPTQRLTLPRDMVELSPENEARVEREQKKMAAIWPNENARLWLGSFLNPLEGEIVTSFGVRRIINKIPKNPHSGVDVSGNEGDPVRSPNGGTVVLVDDQFYSGRSLVIDHGQGIYTMFFHLSKVLVRPGQEVKKGDVVARVGSTGRSTGPHLHWGVRMQGARVDPLELIKLNLE